MRVFILNGPPGIGKDTLAMHIQQLLGFPTMAFKTALYVETARHYDLPLHIVFNLCNVRLYKEVPTDLFWGDSPRSALIHVSENLIKPNFGKKFFGLKAHEEILKLAGVTGSVVFADGGFVEEVECLVEHGHEVHIVQMHGYGFDFKNDSRTYINVAGAMLHTLIVKTGEPLADLEQFINIMEKLNG